MKKLWSMLAILAALFIVSCGDDYDDTAIKNQINDLENRVANLEQLCQQMNTNISSMQTILNALQERDYITSITPIKEGDAVIGYTINFAINDPITIYHGKNGADGKDGYVPSIGVAKFEDDGLYYWTLDGEWLTDAEGNKVRAQGLDGGTGDGGSEGSAGKDGITPQLKIKLNYWYISYDNGATWERLGPATGADGANGRPGKDGDSFFEDVYVKDGYVYFVLVGGDEYVVPTKDTLEAQLKDLQDLIDENYHIKSYKDITDDTGVTIGYELVLVKDGKEETITIMNGKDGAPGEPGTQITVNEEDGTITIVVGEGEFEFKIPKYKEMDLSFVLSDNIGKEVSSVDLVKGTKQIVSYKIKYCEGGHAHTDFHLEVLGDVSIIVTPAADDAAANAACGEIAFFVPFTTEVGTEKIVLFVTDGKSHTTMKTLTVNIKAPKVTDPYFEFNGDGTTAWSGIVIDVDGEGHGTIISWDEFNKKDWPDSKAAIEAYAPAGTWRLPSMADWTIVHNKLTDFNATINAENANNYNGAHPDYSPIYAKSGTSATEAAYWTSDKGTNTNQADYRIYTGTWNGEISFGTLFAKNNKKGYDFMKARCVRDF